MARREYVPRAADELLKELFSALPALLVVGPRAAGKTTTARRLARSLIQLDVPAQAAAFRFDPDAALARAEEPVLLDEWQQVPEVMGAVRRAVDRDDRPGRFLLTGSARARRDADAWSGIGRVVTCHLPGMSVAERRFSAGGPGLFERLAQDDLGLFPTQDPAPNLGDYLDLAFESSFPEPALRLPQRARQAWLTAYVDHLVTRDAASLDGIRDPAVLRRYFEALCVNTAGVVSESTMLRAARISRTTAVKYEGLLQDLFVLDVVPAWHTNRLARLVKSPKRYIADPALAAAALGIGAPGALRDGALLGRLIETFAAGQVRAELDLDPVRPRLHHLRDRDGRHEVDLVAELGGGGILGLEVKATASPGPGDAAHLSWLRDTLGDRFVAGAVLHTGPRPFRLADRILALPMYAFWVKPRELDQAPSTG